MPKEGRIVGRKLLDYRLGLYAAPAISTASERSPHVRCCAASFSSLYRGTPVHARTRLFAAGLCADFGASAQRQSDRAAQCHARRLGSPCCALHGADYPQLVPVLPEEVSITRTFWMLMHADSKDLARIRRWPITSRDRGALSGRCFGAVTRRHGPERDRQLLMVRRRKAPSRTWRPVSHRGHPSRRPLLGLLRMRSGARGCR